MTCLKYIVYFSQARKNQETGKIQFKQAKLILLGFVIMVFGSVDFLPNFGIKVYPFGYLCAMLYMSIFAYMIIRYRLMEIDTVIHRTILWLVASGFIVFPIWVLLYFFKRWFFDLSLLQLSIIVTLIFFVLKYFYNAVQPKIDYIFRRRKYDYYQALGLIASRVGTQLEIRDIVLKLFQELKNTLYMKNGLILTKSSENYDFEEIYRLGYEDLYALGLAQKTKAYLKKDSELLRYLARKPAGMEKDMLLLDPQYGVIKEEAVAFFNANSLELLVPIVLEEDIKGLLGLGKKVNLQKYTHKDIQLLETLGQQLGVIFDNALRHGDLIKKELLDRITDGLDEGIMLLDKDYRVVWANKKIIDAMPAGMNPVNRYCYELTHRAKEPCSEKEHFCPLSEAVKTQSVASAIHVHRGKSGDLAYVEVIVYPLKDTKGNVSEYIHISRDITQKKNMEDDLQNNILNLEKTGEELEGKIKELEIFNKIAVDRELKMIELKSKIAQLEAQQKNGAEGGS
ncbi:PAS domain-containing protein [bacterium]|nr:MAG: PAS domain-containing protein [bacterium]